MNEYRSDSGYWPVDLPDKAFGDNTPAQALDGDEWHRAREEQQGALNEQCERVVLEAPSSRPRAAIDGLPARSSVFFEDPPPPPPEGEPLPPLPEPSPDMPTRYINKIIRTVPESRMMPDISPYAEQPAFGSLFPRDGQTLPALVNISGYGQPGAIVWVALNNTPPNITEVESDGSWSVQNAYPLMDGPHRLRAIQSFGGKYQSMSVDFLIAGKPLPDFVLDIPANGSVIEDRQPVISGTGMPGSVVTVQLLDVGSMDVPISVSGRFSVRFPQQLELGTYTVVASQKTTKVGGEAKVSSTFTVAECMGLL